MRKVAYGLDHAGTGRQMAKCAPGQGRHFIRLTVSATFEKDRDVVRDIDRCNSRRLHVPRVEFAGVADGSRETQEGFSRSEHASLQNVAESVVSDLERKAGFPVERLLL